MRKTRKGGYDVSKPPNQLTPAKLREITAHLRRSQGLGELENVISDLSDVRRLDPEIFTGRYGQRASDILHDIVVYEEFKPEHVGELKADLEQIIDFLAEALDERGPQGGRRRGRKSRRKTLRQRK